LIGGILQLLLGIAVAGGWYKVSGAGWDAIFGVYETVLALATMLGAIMMYNNPSLAHTWGTVIVLLSILSGLNIISLAGGISARRRKTGGVPPPPPPPPPPP
jgi:hypothetical protein